MPSDRWEWWRNKTSASRIAVEDGIKARSKRGAFATQWWAKRWIAVLEGFNLGARLQRGRSYARGGQVIGPAGVPENDQDHVPRLKPRRRRDGH